jgi:hypothetical protein
MNELKLHDTSKIEKPTPSSVGTQSDLKADVNIAKVFGGYFSNCEVAQSFVDAGIKDIDQDLPKDVKLADYGGGQGFLTKTVADWLKSQGHNVDAYVIDGNPKFLQVAQQEGLRSYQCNLENCDFKDADLLLMRAVNHYNSPEKQLEILKSAFKSLNEKGFLISQISSGSEENCRLRSEIANLPSLGRAMDGGNYHWTSIDEYEKLLEEAGFEDSTIVGLAPDCTWTPEEQWDRFNEKELKDVVEKNDTGKIAEINRKREVFIKEAYGIIKQYIEKFGRDVIDVSFNENDQAVIRYKYPIIRSKK